MLVGIVFAIGNVLAVVFVYHAVHKRYFPGFYDHLAVSYRSCRANCSLSNHPVNSGETKATSWVHEQRQAINQKPKPVNSCTASYIAEALMENRATEQDGY